MENGRYLLVSLAQLYTRHTLTTESDESTNKGFDDDDDTGTFASSLPHLLERESVSLDFLCEVVEVITANANETTQMNRCSQR